MWALNKNEKNMSSTGTNCFFIAKTRNESMFLMNPEQLIYVLLSHFSVLAHQRSVHIHLPPSTKLMGISMHIKISFTPSYLEMCVRIPSIIHSHYLSVLWIRNSFLGGGGNFMIIGPTICGASWGAEVVQVVPNFFKWSGPLRMKPCHSLHACVTSWIPLREE